MRRQTTPAPELNLVPVMNLVTILIPFLLFTTGAASVSVHETDAPAMGTTLGEPSPTVFIDQTGLTLVDATGETTPVSCHHPCKQPEDLNLVELTAQLRRLRPAFSTGSITLTSADGVPYEWIIAVMDSTHDAAFDNILFAGAFN